MGDRMRFDRNHLAFSADMTGQHHGIGADIGADIDEYAAFGRMRAQKIQLFEIVIGIEQRAALGGAGLVVKPKRCALIVHVDRSRAQQIDQPRQPGTKRAALQPRAMRKRIIAACAAFGANAPNGAGIGSLSAVKRMVLGGSSACIVALFCHCERSEAIHGAKERMDSSYAAAYRFNHCCLWNTGSPAFAGDDN